MVERFLLAAVIALQVIGEKGIALQLAEAAAHWLPLLPGIEGDFGRVEPVVEPAVQGRVEEPEVPRLVAGQPVADDVHLEGVLTKDHHIGHEVLGPTTEARPLLEAVAVAAVDPLDHVEGGAGGGVVVEGLLRPHLHADPAVPVVEGAWPVPAGHPAGPMAVVEGLDLSAILGIDIGDRRAVLELSVHRAAIVHVGMDVGALPVLGRQGHAHAVGLELGDVEVEGPFLVDGGHVPQALVHHPAGHLPPDHLAAFLQVGQGRPGKQLAAVETGQLGAGALGQGRVRLHGVAVGAIGVAQQIALAQVELRPLQAQLLLHALDDPLDEIGVGEDAHQSGGGVPPRR
jgi:hypothetical protein